MRPTFGYSTQATGAKAVEQHHGRGKAVTPKPWPWSIHGIHVIHGASHQMLWTQRLPRESQALPRERIEAILERRGMTSPFERECVCASTVGG